MWERIRTFWSIEGRFLFRRFWRISVSFLYFCFRLAIHALLFDEGILIIGDFFIPQRHFSYRKNMKLHLTQYEVTYEVTPDPIKMGREQALRTAKYYRKLKLSHFYNLILSLCLN